MCFIIKLTLSEHSDVNMNEPHLSFINKVDFKQDFCLFISITLHIPIILHRYYIYSIQNIHALT